MCKIGKVFYQESSDQIMNYFYQSCISCFFLREIFETSRLFAAEIFAFNNYLTLSLFFVLLLFDDLDMEYGDVGWGNSRNARGLAQIGRISLCQLLLCLFSDI
jgi:hypothetical protein